MILSFGWTWPAFVAEAKDTTRRDWSLGYGARWRLGRTFQAYDRSPRVGGRCIGAGRLIADATRERLAEMPYADYEREGFAYLLEHPGVLPRSARRQPWGQCTLAAFEDWRRSGEILWVVRFRVLSIEDWAREKLEELLAAEGNQATGQRGSEI